MGNKTRNISNLVSDNNIFVDISNDRVGIGSTQPTTKLDVVGTVKATSFSGITTSMISDYGNGLAGGYSNSNVDTHLNTSTASNGEVLSWTGTDYDWVAQSGGSGITTANINADTLNVSGVSTFQDNVILTGVGKSLVVGPSNDQLSLEYDANGLGLIRQNNELFLSSPQTQIINLDGSKVSATFLPTGGVDLRHNNSIKLQTTAFGINVIGHTETDTLNVSGVTTFQSTVNLGDNDRLNFSDTNTRIYGANNALNIEASGTHDILIKSNADGATNGNVEISAGTDGGKVYLTGAGGVGIYHTDTALKLETTGYGVTVYGGVNATGVSTFQDNVHLLSNDHLYFGSNNDIDIYSDGTTGRLITSDNFYIRAPQFAVLNNAGTQTIAIFQDSNGVSLYHNNSKKLETTNTGVVVTGILTATSFVKSGGTSSQFLKADGSVDTSTYLTSFTETQTLDDVVGLGSNTTQTITVGTATTGVVVRPDGSLNVSGVSTFLDNVNIGTAATTVDLPGLYLKGNSAEQNFITNPSISIGGTAAGKWYDTFLVDGPNLQYVRHWASDFDINFSVPDDRIFVVSNTDGSSSVSPAGVVDGHIAFKINPETSTELRYNKSTKLETTNTGVVVTGILTATSFSGITTSMISDYGNGLAGGYSNTNVDTHLNTSTASSGEVLSWTGTDYDWVAQSGGGSGFSPDSQENLYSGTGAGAASDADTCFNIGIGYSAGASLNSGDNNIFLGCCAGNSTDSGYSNVFLGTKAGANHTSGNYNVAIGQCANASGTTTGQHNVFVGCGAGDCVTSGCDNVYLGRGAGNDVTTARCNIALGFYAGSSNLAGIHNIFLGNNAGGNSSSGNCNINIGQRTGFCNAGGNLNNFIGHYAGFHNTTGCFNNYFGYAAGYCNCTGSSNNIFGENAGFDLASGSNNVFIGNYSGKLQTSGDCNIAIGHNACFPNKTGSSQLAVGAGNTNWISGDSSFNVTVNCITATKFCGDGSCLTNLPSSGGGGSFSPDAQENLYAGTSAGTSSSNACFNIGIGYSAGNALSIGDCNVLLGAYAGTNVDAAESVFIGRNAGKGQSGATSIANVFIGPSTGCCVTSGSFNVFLGCGAGRNITTGQNNIFLGLGAGQSNCTGIYNVNIGANAGGDNRSCYNVFLGAYAGGGNTDGSHNIFIGCCAGCNSGSGHRNIAIGNNAACCIGTNGNYNIFLGEYAGHTTTSGSNNVAIGHSVALPSATGDAQFAIGCGTNRWIYGDSNFNIYDKDGNQLNGSGGGGGGGLSYFTESENTSSPNNTVAANRFLATGSGTNIDAVLQPKGTGAFLAQLPDSATTGGNKRGCYAVDLQMIRGCATCVASGPFASIAGGCGNKAGDCGFVGGGVLNSASWWGSVTGGCSNSANSNWAHVGGGHGNSAGYAGVVAGGQSNNASTYASVLGGFGNRATGYMAAVVGTRGSCANGDCSVAIGYKACNHGRHGSIAIGAGAGVFGDNHAKIQYSIMNIGRDTTDATQTVLHAEGSSCSAASDNQLHLKNNSAYLYSGQVIANVTGGGDTHAWEFSGIIKKGTGNVALVGTPNINDIGYDSGASGWSIAVCADTSNASLAVCVTGQASTNIRWGATLRTTEIMH